MYKDNNLLIDILYFTNYFRAITNNTTTNLAIRDIARFVFVSIRVLVYSNC